MHHRLAVAAAVMLAFAGCGIVEGEPSDNSSASLAANVAPCTTLSVLRGSIGSGQTAKALAVADQTGTQDSWSKYVEFAPNTAATCTMTLPTAAGSPTGLTLKVNYRGPRSTQQQWSFHAWDYASGSWVQVSTNAFAQDWRWTSASVALPAPIARFISNGAVKMRYSTSSSLDASLLDQWVVLVDSDGQICTPESNTQFCSRLGKNCGSVSGTDNCGASRTVSSCGTCSGTDVCGSTNVCQPAVCTPESNTQFCTRLGKNCGSVSGTDNCGASRTVSTCGTCSGTDVCGSTNVCQPAVRAPESDAQFCSRLAKNCGSVSGTDNCGGTRTVSSCGTCASPLTCGGGGALNVCGGSTSTGKTLIVAPSGGDYTSVQTAMNTAQAGDTVLVRAGIYAENVSFPRNGSASAGYITLKGEAGAILDGTGKGQVGITLNNRSYVKVIGLTVRNYKGTGTPMGISVEGGGSFIELRNNLVHNIENANGNAHGIAFYGTSTTALSNIVVDGNEVRNCKLGQSESLVLNGNVTDFVVSHNVVHDNDNIAIDFIGFEGTGPAGLDQARNGVCTDNIIYNISSASNPTYGGERSADGVYVDGGKDIVIERNRIDNADIGIEVASEHGGKTTANITVRNNFVSRSFQGSVMMGGYASAKGNAANIQVYNNTLYQGGDGEVVLQFNCSGVYVKNNIMYAKSGNGYVVNSGGNNTNVNVDTNLYFGASTTSSGSYSDLHPKFANPLMVSAPTNLHLQAGSPAINAGLALGNDASGKPLSGSLDIDGSARVTGAAINLGAHEL